MVPRPEKIYLDAPTTIAGIEVRCTPAGLKYLIEHFETVLQVSTQQVMSNDVRTHVQKQIDNYKIHLQLYEQAK